MATIKYTKDFMGGTIVEMDIPDCRLESTLEKVEGIARVFSSAMQNPSQAASERLASTIAGFFDAYGRGIKRG